MTQWGGPGFDGEPVDPNPADPLPPPGFYGPAPPPVGYPGPRSSVSGYPTGAYPPPYPWSGYGAPPGPARPATVAAACVLAFILGGLVLLDGFLLLVGASVVQGIEESLNQSSGLPPSLVVNGLLNLAVGAGLITGGLMLARCRASGRTVLVVADVVAVGQSIYWTVVSQIGAAAVTVLHAALAVTGLVLAFTVQASTWLRAGQSGHRPG